MMKLAIIRQRAVVAEAWARADQAKTPREAKRRTVTYYNARRELAQLQIARWQIVSDARDRGRCPRCHRAISLAEAENYR